MADVTVTTMISQIDNLVLDYIRRRPNISVPETKPFWKKCTASLTELWSAPVGNLTLEKIYCHYLTGNSFPCDIVTPKLEVRKCDTEINEALPLLPVEVVEQVFEFRAVAKLLPLRLLSRTMNNIVSKHICRVPAKIVTLNEPEQVGRFIEYFEKRIIGLSSIFGAYRFGGLCEGTLRVLRLVGPSVKFARFEAKHFDMKILSKIPNVQVLHFIGLPNIAENTLTDTAKLTKLKRLILDLEVTKDDLRHLTMNHVLFWLQLAPNLRKLTSHIRGDIEYPDQYLDFFRRYIGRIKLTQHILFIGHQEMRVTVSGYSPGGELRSLYDAAAVPSPLPYSIPPLTHVTLWGANNANFENFVFESVRSLVLSDLNLGRSNALPLFHINFPRIIDLHLHGYLHPKDINYFASSFADVSTLKLSGFESRSPTPPIPIFEEEIAHGHIAQWPFSNLKKLKRLEFVCDDSVDASLRQTVLGVVRFTLQRSIQPLDLLKITYFPPLQKTQLKVEELQTLFNSMTHLNYHKHLIIIKGNQTKIYNI